MIMKNFIQINARKIGDEYPTYFVADIAANHDGDLGRAKELILLAKSAGADAVKFQHHDVKKYVSDHGFKSLGGKFSHQQKWEKSIFEVYKDAEVPQSWTKELFAFCKLHDVDFFSTPYDLDMVDHLDEYVPAYKIGSGDLNWHAMLEKVAKTNKPIIIATGASNIGEVDAAINVIRKHNNEIVLMQCNTNYTGAVQNFKYINLNVISTYGVMFPDVILGLSDHTPGHVTTLGAIALGARVVEKHFTDDTKRPGPDHPFSMDFNTWKNMVDDSRILELSMGEYQKKVQDNEIETSVLQRRAIRTVVDINAGDRLTLEMVQYQRPAPSNAISINDINLLLGKTAQKNILAGDYIRNEHICW
jgi:sialic acid synthase SpsE